MKFTRALLVLSVLFVTKLLYAPPGLPPSGSSPTGPTTPPSGNPCWDPAACVPIDTGVVFLLLAGAVLGISFAMRLRSSKAQ
jgi:hypothetical protein